MARIVDPKQREGNRLDPWTRRLAQMYDRLGRTTRPMLARLIARLFWAGSLATLTRRTGTLNPYERREFDSLGALRLIVEHAKDWIRDPDDWLPESDPQRLEIRGLVRFLLARFEVPDYFENVWFGGYETRQIQVSRSWYVHVAQGKNWRDAEGVPIPLSRKEVHHALQASRVRDPWSAIRWGQVRQLGGSRALAKKVADSMLGHDYAEPHVEAFRLAILRYLIRYEAIQNGDLDRLIKFLEAEKFGQIITDDGLIRITPRQPGFCLQGRAPETLVARADAWHRNLSEEEGYPLWVRWARSGLAEWNESSEVPAHVSELRRGWIIRELTRVQDLVDEGNAMDNCVAGYTGRCLKGESRIWSLACIKDGTLQRLVTFEVDPRGSQLVQARASENEDPTPEQRRVLEFWAARVGLTCAEGIWTEC